MRLALFEPDIPQNTGTMMRLAACLGVPVDVIEPCGFPFSDKGFRRAGLDYLDLVDLTVHRSWAAFCEAHEAPTARFVLLSTRAPKIYSTFAYTPCDTLIVGRERSGVPQDVHDRVDARVRIPMVAKARSLNVALAAAIVLGEALRQVDGFPPGGPS